MKFETILYRKKPHGKNACIKFRCEAVVSTPQTRNLRGAGEGFGCRDGALFIVNGERMCRRHAAVAVIDILSSEALVAEAARAA